MFTEKDCPSACNKFPDDKSLASASNPMITDKAFIKKDTMKRLHKAFNRSSRNSTLFIMITGFIIFFMPDYQQPMYLDTGYPISRIFEYLIPNMANLTFFSLLFAVFLKLSMLFEMIDLSNNEVRDTLPSRLISCFISIMLLGLLYPILLRPVDSVIKILFYGILMTISWVFYVMA